MPIIKNRSFSASVIALPEGRSLTLSGRCSAEISGEDFSSAEIQRLFAAGEIFVLPETTASPPGEAPEERDEKPAPAPSHHESAQRGRRR